MKFRYVVLVLLPLFLASCSIWKRAGSSPPGAPTEYVEVSNPMQTASSSSPATIWVPAKAEGGIPRGGVLVQEGIDELRGKSGNKETQQATLAVAPPTGPDAAPPGSTVVSPSPASTGRSAGAVPRTVVPVPLAAPVPITVKKRIAISETGKNSLIASFSNQIRVMGIGVPVEISSQGSTPDKENEMPAFAGNLWKDNVASVLVIVSAPDGIAGGLPLVADIYDGIEKSSPRRVSTVIPLPAGSDKVSRDASLTTALADLSLRVGDVVNLTPWYGRIFAVEGERVYFNAGRESGIQVGQKLKVYRGGKIIAGIGFDPGTQVTTLEIAGFVGTNGSYGVVRDGQSVNLSDTVSCN